MKFSPANSRRPTFRLACPSHLNLSLIIALERGIEPNFSYSLLFEIRFITSLQTKRNEKKTGIIFQIRQRKITRKNVNSRINSLKYS